MRTVRELLEESAQRLEQSGIEQPRRDAVTLIADALELDVDDVLQGDAGEVGPAEQRRIHERVSRRGAREPLSYIVGRTRFRGLELAVDSRVHVPRDDRTGLLVEVALELPAGARVHEVGTGSGAVALAIKHERPDLVVSASDISSAAIEVARANAVRLGLAVTFEVHDNLPPGRFDRVVANLPYSALVELERDLPPESASYQPHVALVAGAGALDAIRAFVLGAPSGLPVALEHAPGQTEEVEAMLRAAVTRHDRAGDERMTLGIVP